VAALGGGGAGGGRGVPRQRRLSGYHTAVGDFTVADGTFDTPVHTSDKYMFGSRTGVRLQKFTFQYLNSKKKSAKLNRV